ncbi:MAG: hypothetical protein ACI9FJ_003013, partial [Alteromonadaceae bacterium]
MVTARVLPYIFDKNIGGFGSKPPIQHDGMRCV